MSNKGSRKSQTAALTEEKDKRQVENPAKDMKKKVAANTEKDKADKSVKSPDKPEKHTEKDKDKPNEKGDSKKADKHPEKNSTPEKTDKADKKEKHDKKTEKVESEKKVDKKTDKTAEKVNDKKTEKPVEKVSDKKTEKPVEKVSDKKTADNDKKEKEKKEDHKDDGKSNTNGKEPEKPRNGTNGTNGTDSASVGSASDEELLVIDSQDECFPELAYDESDGDADDAPRSLTRRDQVKVTKTPETPRPASFKEDDSKEKVLKSDPLASDRKLRSSDSPKPESKKEKKQESPKKTVDLTGEDAEDKEKKIKEIDVVVEVDTEGEPRRTRARVSPYSRATTARLDTTTTSVQANYTGNNTTMEMDITESSILEPEALDSSAYLRSLRTIKGRGSYKPLKELQINRSINRSLRSNTSLNASASEVRPTGTVVGRKRKPSEDEPPSPSAAPSPSVGVVGGEGLHSHSKRMRLLERFSLPFRGFNARRAAEIHGINSDLPLTAPVSPAALDPESLKAPAEEALAPEAPLAVPLGPADLDAGNKRCVIV